MTWFLVVMLMLTSCQSVNSSSTSSVPVEGPASRCSDIIRQDNAVVMVMNGFVKDVQVSIAGGQTNPLVVDEIRRMALSAELLRNEPLIEFRKACALKCVAYETLSDVAEADLCQDDGKCEDLRRFMIAYAPLLDLQLGKPRPESSHFPIAIQSAKDRNWYSLSSERNECKFQGLTPQDLAVSFYHPSKELKVELRHGSGRSLLIRRECTRDPCTLENEAVELLLKKDTFRRLNKIYDSGKFVLQSQLRNGQQLLIKVDDCVAEIKNTDGEREPLFPRDDVSCLNLEKVKQSLLHAL